MKKLLLFMFAIVAHFFSSAQCAHTLNMIDTYGDGWNGSAVDVTVNGAVVVTGATINSGASALENFQANTGDAIALANWVTGSWTGEVQWNITDGAGNVIASGLHGDVTGGVGACPNCPPPSGLTLANLGSTSVDISWTPGGTETEWYFEINGSGSSVTSTSQSVTGLSVNDTAYVYIASICGVGDTSGVIGGFFITYPTAPNAPAGVTCTSATPGVALADDFEGAVNWTGDIVTGNGGWKVDANGTGSGGTGPDAAHSGANYMYYEASVGGSDTATLVSPAVDLTAGADAAELSFWMHAAGTTVGTLEVGVGTSATGPFTSVFTWTGNYQFGTGEAWIPVGIDLTSYIGQTIYLGYTVMRDVSVTPNWSSDIAIDLVEVNSCFSCLAPSGLTASNITANSADVSWTAGASETEWMLNVNGTTSVETSTTVSLTGLTGNTAYNMSVMAICGVGDTSVASPSGSFNTLCNADVAPTNENFDAGFSNCWSQETADSLDWLVGTGGTPSGGTGPSDDFTGGGNYMYIETSVPVAYGDVATMYSSVIDISALTNAELRFLSHMYGDAIGTLTVDMWDMTTGSPTNSTNVFTKSGDQGNVWNEELVLLTGAPSTVIFQVTAVVDSNAGGQSWTGDMAIDEFGIREAIASDLAIVAAVAPSGCDLTSTEPIEVWVVNQGLVAESNFDVSYEVNGGALTTETIAGPLAPGDTAMYVFTATADMSADNVYNVDLECMLANDGDTLDNLYSTTGENYETPAAATTMGDTICSGDSAMISAMADGYVTWWDAATGGNEIGDDEDIYVSPTTTTAYYAQVAAVSGFEDDFESYTDGDLIAQSSNDWSAWTGPNGGGADDAAVSSAQAASGSNSLHLDNGAGDDVVLPFGEAFTSGYFGFETKMLIVTNAYFNFQADVNIGAAWAFDIFLDGGVLDVQVGGASVLTGSYSGTDPMGNPTWITVGFEGDISSGTWEAFINGNSQGTFAMTLPVASINFYANTGNDYYIDDVEWAALKDDACLSGTRTEAIVNVVDCSNINELSKENVTIYPNPNKGEFSVTNSSDIINLNITDVQGKVVHSMNDINLNNVEINITDLEKGMYFINVETVNGTVTETVVVK
jgi:hypothetical protein